MEAECLSFLATHSDVKSAAGIIKAQNLDMAMRKIIGLQTLWRIHCNYHGNDIREVSYLTRHER